MARDEHQEQSQEVACLVPELRSEKTDIPAQQGAPADGLTSAPLRQVRRLSLGVNLITAAPKNNRPAVPSRPLLCLSL